jgi:hypothetical protein
MSKELSPFSKPSTESRLSANPLFTSDDLIHRRQTMNGPNFQKLTPAIFRGPCWRRFALICLVTVTAGGACSMEGQTSTTALPSADPKWFVSMSLGEGQLKLQSDQQSWDRIPTFSIGFDLGRKVCPWARAGAEVNGWLLQAFDLNNPAVGESVGHVMVIGDALLLRRDALFVRAGVGRSSYTNNQPTGYGGGGLAWMTGGGYEIRVTRALSLVPTVGYSAGNLGSGGTPVPQTHFGYSVIEFKLGVLHHFGS